jgi:diguanylate cyclase (GGDEF)-like protein
MVLERFSNILSGGRLSDIACRWGGEEFAIILPQTTMSQAFDVTERFRSRLANVIWPEHPGLVITASFGVCDIDNSDLPPNPTNLFLSAEKAMYAAKEQGKNRVECFLNKVNATK